MSDLLNKLLDLTTFVPNEETKREVAKFHEKLKITDAQRFINERCGIDYINKDIQYPIEGTKTTPTHKGTIKTQTIKPKAIAKTKKKITTLSEGHPTKCAKIQYRYDGKTPKKLSSCEYCISDKKEMDLNYQMNNIGKDISKSTKSNDTEKLPKDRMDVVYIPTNVLNDKAREEFDNMLKIVNHNDKQFYRYTTEYGDNIIDLYNNAFNISYENFSAKECIEFIKHTKYYFRLLNEDYQNHFAKLIMDKLSVIKDPIILMFKKGSKIAENGYNLSRPENLQYAILVILGIDFNRHIHGGGSDDVLDEVKKEDFSDYYIGSLETAVENGLVTEKEMPNPKKRKINSGSALPYYLIYGENLENAVKTYGPLNIKRFQFYREFDYRLTYDEFKEEDYYNYPITGWVSDRKIPCSIYSLAVAVLEQHEHTEEWKASFREDIYRYYKAEKNSFPTAAPVIELGNLLSRSYFDGYYVSLYYYDGDKMKVHDIGDATKKQLKIALYDNHYFSYEDVYHNGPNGKTYINKNALSDRNKHFDVSRYETYINQFDKSGKPKYVSTKVVPRVNSLEFIREKIGHKHEALADKLDKWCVERDGLDENIMELSEMPESTNQKKQFFNKSFNTIFVGDIKSREKNGILEPYLVSYGSMSYNKELGMFEASDNIVSFSGKNCIENMFSRLRNEKGHVVIYFYNLMQSTLPMIGKLIKELKNKPENPTMKDNVLYRIKLDNVEIRDASTIIPVPIENFPKAFELTRSRVEIPDMDGVEFAEIGCKPLLVSIVDATESVVKHGKLNEQLQYDMVEYVRCASKNDVMILMDGMIEAHKLSIKKFGVSLFDYLTIASASDSYMQKKGCYDNVRMLNGTKRAFVSKTIRGGYCSIGRGGAEPYDVLSEVIALDNNSLFPYAMDICMFPEGDGVVLRDKKLCEIQKYPIYYAKVMIKNANNIDPFKFIPLVSYLDSMGRVEYGYDSQKYYYMNHIDIAELLKYKCVEKNDIIIKEGLFYEKAINKPYKNIIKDLYQARLEANGAENTVIKMFMNSSYGKQAVRPISEKYVFVDTPLTEYMHNHYVDSFSYVGENKEEVPLYLVKKIVNTFSHANNVHCASIVLSTARMVMNRIFNAISSIGAEIHYCDTDSVFFEAEKLDDIKTTYQALYDRELIGHELGQFKLEFNKDKKKKEVDRVAVESSFIGRKCYYNKFNDGEERVRMKGIPGHVIQYGSISGVKIHSIRELYKSFLQHKKAEFELCLSKDGSKCKRVKVKFSMLECRIISAFGRTVGLN